MRQEPEITQMAMQMYTTAKAGPLCAGGIGSYAFMLLLDSLGSDNMASLERVLQECKSRDPNDAIHYEFVRSILESDKKASASMFMFPAQVNLHNNPPRKTLHRTSPPEIMSVSVLPCSIHFRAGASTSRPPTHPKSPILTLSTYPMRSMSTFSPVISDF